MKGVASIRSGAFGRKGSMVVAAAGLGFLFAGSTLVTPIYAAYRETFRFSELTLTVIYAVYALGNLGALLLLGRLSDQVGRRRVVLMATALAGASALLFLFASSTAWLVAARIVSGLAIGLGSGTTTAWLAELDAGQDETRPTITAVLANMSGLAVGAIAGGFLSQYAPWPLRLPYVAYLAVLILLGILVWFAVETVKRPVGRLAQLSLRPRLGVPRGIRAQFFAPAVTVFSSFALFGFYAALAPTILGEEMHQSNRAVGGGVVFELSSMAALAVVATHRLESRRAMLSGLSLLLPSLFLLIWAQAAGSMSILLVGTTVAGAANALCYRGSLQVINQIAPRDRRAEVVSSYLVAGFAGNSLPIVGVGVLSSIAEPIAASATFAVTIALLVIAALVIETKYGRPVQPVH